MSFDYKSLGQKIKNCREHLALSIVELSQKTGITIQRLKPMEEGDLEPSGDEILILADFFKVDYQYFISNQDKTASDQIDILYRKYGDNFSKEDRYNIQEFVYLCECEQFLFEELNIKLKKFSYFPKGNFYKSHGEDGASSLRKFLGYTPDSIIGDIFSDFRSLGIHIFRRKLFNSTISGLFIKHPIAGDCILVNYDEDLYRQNFTLAHEMGHAIFDSNEQINVSFKNDDYRKLEEIRANTFAANYLIPKEGLQNLNVQRWDRDIVLKVAKQLKINVTPLLIALKNAQLINEAEYTSIRKGTYISDEKEESEFIGLTEKRKKEKRILLHRGLSEFYVRKCFEVYLNGTISSNRLSEMLLCNEFELPELLALYNYKLNYGN